MPKSYTNLLYHIVFSTSERRPLITPDRRESLYEYIGGTVRGLGGISLSIGGIEDHLHLLAKLRPDKALSDGPNAWPLKHMKALLEAVKALDQLIKSRGLAENLVA